MNCIRRIMRASRKCGFSMWERSNRWRWKWRHFWTMPGMRGEMPWSQRIYMHIQRHGSTGISLVDMGMNLLVCMKSLPSLPMRGRLSTWIPCCLPSPAMVMRRGRESAGWSLSLSVPTPYMTGCQTARGRPFSSCSYSRYMRPIM